MKKFNPSLSEFFSFMSMPSNKMFKIFTNKKGGADLAGPALGAAGQGAAQEATKKMAEKKIFGGLLKNSIASSVFTAVIGAVLIGLLSKACEEDEEEEKKSPPSQQQVQVKSCASLGGQLCTFPPGCGKGIEQLAAGETDAGLMCCRGSCLGDEASSLFSISKEQEDSCIQKQGNVCTRNQFCDNNEWVDKTTKCCAKNCLDRLFSNEFDIAGITFNSIRVEKTNGKYWVWWGQKYYLADRAERALAECASGLCTFEALNSNNENQAFSFRMQDEDGKLVIS
tara:strand:+ start:1050 stop:1895 length:846 start_codon:yes stop_codon:yes gene_type:complete